ncbi:hypothetical protein [Chitinilyticum aquatile]|uniref:hypothetical protein n=1 Tax=Chitinilyticum aquatile TaxID=362520 RepID=UPI00040958E0|nr:hypothetical protein [Chitinilyticum aquatile]
MNVYDLRLHLLRQLIQQHGGLAAFSELTGIDKSTLSRCAGRNPSERIGTRLANRIETAIGLKPDHLSDFSTLIDSGGKLPADMLATAHPAQKRLISYLLHYPIDATTARALLLLARRRRS